MFALKMPYMLLKVPNPVFNSELRRVRRLRTAESLTRYSRIVLLVPFVAIMAWWLLSVLAFAQAAGVQKFAIYHTFDNITSVLLTVIVFATLITALAVDLYAVAVTINSIRHEMAAGHWDLLRLTPLSAKTCIAAKHGIAQIRVWRVLALEVAVRMSGIIILIAWRTFDYDFWWNSYVRVWPLFDELGRSFQYHPVASATNLILSAVLVAAYITEPLWRMRVITAFGLALSASVRNLTFGALSALALVIALHVAQVAIFAVVIRFGNAFLPYRVAALLEIGTATAILMFLYRAVHNAALNYAYRKAFHAE